jgi:non-ribosomal peptide synthetase component F
MAPGGLAFRLSRVDHPLPGGDEQRRKRADMTTAMIERDGAGQTLPAPAIPDLTLPQFVLGAAYRRGSKRALVDAATGQEVSYAGLADAVREVGAGLSARGMRPGDVLALCAPNSIEFAVAWYAAASIGAIVTTVNPQCTRDEIARQLRQAGARWMVTTAGLAEQTLRGVTAEAAITETFVIGEHGAGAIPFWSLRATADAPAGPVSASDLALLPTSSGTTGLPKSVELTHRNLVASLCQTWLVHQVAGDDVVMAALPLFHIYGLQITLNLALLAGATVIILPRSGWRRSCAPCRIIALPGPKSYRRWSSASRPRPRSATTTCPACACSPRPRRRSAPTSRARAGSDSAAGSSRPTA